MNQPRYYAGDFDRPGLRKVVAIAIAALAITHLLAFWIGGELNQVGIERDVAASMAADPKDHPTESCALEEVERARRHVSACYHRELERRFGN